MYHAEELHSFILAPKPDWCRDKDVSIMAYFIAVADEHGHSTPMQTDICSATGVNYNSRSLRNSLDRLHQHTWITWRKVTEIGARHSYQVHFENLPRFDRQTLTKETHEGA